jgi:hypothetical protein
MSRESRRAKPNDKASITADDRAGTVLAPVMAVTPASRAARSRSAKPVTKSWESARSR